MDAWSRVAPGWSLALALLLLAFAPATAAQEDDGAVRIEDARDDVSYRQGQNELGQVADTHPHVDLVEAWISNETASDFEVGYRLQVWDDPFAAQGMTARYVEILFIFGNVSYVLTHGPTLDGHRCLPDAAFGPGTGGGFPSDRDCLPVDVDDASATARVTVPKNLIESISFLEPRVGDVLTGFFVESRQLTGFGFAVDRAPDHGFADPFRFRVGSSARGGDLYLRADVPVRASNGESTTMVFNVELGNEGDSEQSVSLAAIEDNPTWAVRLPQRMLVPPDSAVRVPVILSMEFTHEHAKTEFFRVRAEAVSDPRHWAEIELGVSWLDIPQPAGHHDRLWLHSYQLSGASSATGQALDSALGQTSEWFNAIQDDPDPRATDEPVPGLPADNDLAPAPAQGLVTKWEFDLRPGLQIGLDPDPTRLGSFVTEIFTYAPATSAELTVELLYCDPTATIPGETSSECGRTDALATLVRLLTGTSAARALGTNAWNSFTIELTPNASAELLPHQPGSRLSLLIQLTTNTPQSTTFIGQPPMPTLDPKKSLLTVPLHEYHDPIDQQFLSVGSVSLDALDPFDKRVNPGRGSVFRYDLTNEGDEPHTMSLQAEGINPDWARVHEGAEIVVPPHETKQVSLIVQAPDDAVAGERAELFLVAQSQENPNVVALGRVRVTVIELTVMDIPDEAASLSPATGNGSTPGFSAALMVLAVSLLALTWRRRY